MTNVDKGATGDIGVGGLDEVRRSSETATSTGVQQNRYTRSWRTYFDECLRPDMPPEYAKIVPMTCILIPTEISQLSNISALKNKAVALNGDHGIKIFYMEVDIFGKESPDDKARYGSIVMSKNHSDMTDEEFATSHDLIINELNKTQNNPKVPVELINYADITGTMSEERYEE